MGFLKGNFSTADIGNYIAQGPATYTATKLGGLNPEEMRMASAASGLLGLSLLGAGSIPSGGGANVGGTGGATGAPQIGAYPGITPGAPTAPPTGETLFRLGSMLSRSRIPEIQKSRLQQGSVYSSKDRRRR